jgi:hypothetical protein
MGTQALRNAPADLARLQEEVRPLKAELSTYQADARHVARVSTCWALGAAGLAILAAAGATLWSKAAGKPNLLLGAQVLTATGTGLFAAWNIGMSSYHIRENRRLDIDQRTAQVKVDKEAVRAQEGQVKGELAAAQNVVDGVDVLLSQADSATAEATVAL